MYAHNQQRTHAPGVEDVLLALLGLIAGPLLWWMGQSWQEQPSASSMHMLEYWIALFCGWLGVAFITLWAMYLIAGAAYLIGLKTRQTALTYWSELLTPRFLRRILISAIGMQLIVTSQAVASPEQQSNQSDSSAKPTQDAFIPHVEIPESPRSTVPEIELEFPSSSESPQIEDTMPSARDPSPETSQPANDLTPMSREVSAIEVTPSPDTTGHEITPMPRQTTTLPVEPTVSDELGAAQQTQLPQHQKYTPPPVSQPPYISDAPRTEYTEAETIVIKTGDCLWDIAHYELGAEATLFQIDHRWREWWEYNSAVIGDDPHTLQPGTILKIPPFVG